MINPHKKLLIGLTGPIGSGKSLVASIWEQFGAGIVSGDNMGRLALSVDVGLRRKLAERFGDSILDDEGGVIPSKLAEAAFSDTKSASDLTRLTFSTLNRLARERFQELSEKHSIIIYDAALIFEWGIEHDFERVVVVTAPLEDLIGRASKRLNISRVQAENRLEGQISIEEKVRRADIVIINDGSIEELKLKAGKVWEEIIR
ncbi:MAG: dephospho-CoA kinase [Calditrichaeota bacterium]|nr:dephospho-CoA kinase [Calditrichota bacterium]